MKSRMVDDAGEKNMLADVLIHIIGPNMLQNELLTSFLENNLGAECRRYEMLDSNFITTLDPNNKHFLLVDCLGEKQTDPWEFYQFNGISTAKQFFLAFYNVNAQSDIEKKAIGEGVHGLFYQEESFKVLPKAITAILNGELWFSRKTMSKCISSGSHSNGRVNTDMACCLTEREREILIRVATGTGNQKIADELYISLHTVKTHIYNIYKKIHVKNRLQASLWAARYV